MYDLYYWLPFVYTFLQFLRLLNFHIAINIKLKKKKPCKINYYQDMI